MSFKPRILFALVFSLPALLVTTWFVTDANSNWIASQYGAVFFVAMIVIPVWVGMLYAETKYRRMNNHSMPAVPLLSIVYPLLYLAFFFVVWYCQDVVDRLNLVNAHGHASSVGLVIGAWAWYGLVFMSFVLLCLIRGQKPTPTGQAERGADGKTPEAPQSPH